MQTGARNQCSAAASGAQAPSARLSDGDVHIWTIPLAELSPSLSSFRPILGPEERERAGRFHRPSDRDRYIAAHGALRTILAPYVAADPSRLHFVTAPHGKPSLRREPGWPDIRFNLSHSGAMAVCAVALGREVGIDVERIDPDRANGAIAARYFSSDEVAALQRLSESDRTRGFFNCWTRKEAYVKGRGEGLQIPLSEFAVSLAPGEPAALVFSRVDAADVDRWSLREVPVPEGYVAALAVESSGDPVDVTCRTFPTDWRA